MKKPSNVRFITPRNTLKEKVGSGGIAPERVIQAQQKIESDAFDFLPVAKTLIRELEQHVSEAKTIDSSNSQEQQETLDKIRETIMELKANGGMFKYQLISDVASISLRFVEDIKTLNDDVFEMLDAHVKTFNAMTASALKGDGGAAGAVLVDELVKANTRYFEKHDEDNN